MSPDMIALRLPLKVGARDYEFGDRFDIDGHIHRRELGEGQIAMLDRQGFIGLLTRERYQIAMARRSPDQDKIGRGFTEAYLIEKGIIDPAPPAEDKKAAPTAAAEKPKKSVPGAKAPKPAPVEVEDYRGQKIVRVMMGKFPRWEATNSVGELLREARFQKPQSARDFIDKMLGSTDSAPPATTGGAQQEPADDRVLQSESERPHLEGAPADR